MRVEPVGDSAAVLDAVRRLPTPREVVIVLGEADEDGLLAEHVQRDEEVLGRFDRTAEVALGVKNKQRRVERVDVREGRALDEILSVPPWIGARRIYLAWMRAHGARVD